jgi:phage terminase large subunit-like protein
MAKKNGKSFLTGGLPIYHLLMEDDEVNPEAYGCGAARDQASIVFKAAARLVRANPDLGWRLKILESTKRIVRRDGGGFYQVLSGDGDVQDGIEPSLLILDEIHRYRSGKAETLYDVTTKGQLSRPNPLALAITTAGSEFESPLWFREYEFAKAVMRGALKSDTTYVAIWEADRKRMESDPEYWKSREARVAGNPSHEDLGGFLKDAAIVKERDKAINQPAEKSKYLRYNLNVPIQSYDEPIIDITKWRTCCGDVDVSGWPEYDFKQLVRDWGLANKPCWAGVDASWATDLTSLVFCFPPDRDFARWTLLPFFWMPKDRIPDLERVCRVPFASWAERKFIEATDGETIDMRAVKDRVTWGRGTFNLREVCFDRAYFLEQAKDLCEAGISAIEVQQDFMHLSSPTKKLLQLVVEKNLRHGNHPVLNWNAGCLQLKYDGKDLCQPAKPERLKSTKRIDGIAAAVDAIFGQMRAAPKKISVYATRGLLRV